LNAKKKKLNEKGKKATIVAWSDSDFDENKDEDNEVANLCFVENRKEAQSKLEFSGHYTKALNKL